jgi:hypothetical protein
LLPVTGQTLPLISRGTSLMTCIALGIIIEWRRKKKKWARTKDTARRMRGIAKLIDDQIATEDQK